MKNIPSLIVFLVIAVGGGTLMGTLNMPGEWHAALIKPPINPPNWVFGPVWTVLYIMIGVAGWRVWQDDPKGLPVKLWAGQMLLNFMWSPLFFGAHRIDFALGIIVLMWVAIIMFIAKTWHQNRPAALLFIPYAAWVSFATLLNGWFFFLNGPTGT